MTPNNDPSDASLITTKERVVKSALALGIRQISMHGISIISNIIVSNLLSPSDFGLYAIFLFIVTIINTTSDLGLGLGLLRESKLPEKKVISVVYTFSMCISAVIFVILWLIAPLVVQKYALSVENIDQIRLLGIVPFFFSFQNLNTIVFDKQLKFSFVAKIELLAHFTANLSLIILAWAGHSSWAFISCILIKPILSSTIYYFKNQSRPSISFDFHLLRGRFKHGLFMQSSNMISIIKDSIVPVFIGYYLGKESVGIMNWAGIIAGYPILLIGSLNRLYLPVLSNLAMHKEKSNKFVSIILRFNHFLVAPLTVLLALYAYQITLVVYSAKWLPGIMLLRLFLFGNFFSATSIVCLPILNAYGKAHLTFLSTSIWAFMTWAIGLPLVLFMGINGFGIAHISIALTNIYLFSIAHNLINVKWLKDTFKFWLVSFVLFIPPLALFHSTNILFLVVSILISAIAYLYITIHFNFINIKEIRQWFESKKN